MSAPLISSEELNQLTDFSYALGGWVMTHDDRCSTEALLQRYKEIKPVLDKTVSAEEITHILCEVQPWSKLLPEFEKCLRQPDFAVPMTKANGSDEFVRAVERFEQAWNRHSEEMGMPFREELSLEKEAVNYGLAKHLGLTHGVALEQTDPLAVRFDKNRMMIRDLLPGDDGAAQPYSRDAEIQTAINTLALQMTFTQGVDERQRRTLEKKLQDRGISFKHIARNAEEPLEIALSGLDEKLVAGGAGDHLRRAFNNTLRNTLAGMGMDISGPIPEFDIGNVR